MSLDVEEVFSNPAVEGLVLSNLLMVELFAGEPKRVVALLRVTTAAVGTVGRLRSCSQVTSSPTAHSWSSMKQSMMEVARSRVRYKSSCK